MEIFRRRCFDGDISMEIFRWRCFDGDISMEIFRWRYFEISRRPSSLIYIYIYIYIYIEIAVEGGPSTSLRCFISCPHFIAPHPHSSSPRRPFLSPSTRLPPASPLCFRVPPGSPAASPSECLANSESNPRFESFSQIMF